MKEFLGIIIALPFILLVLGGLILYAAFSWGYVACIFHIWFIQPLNLGIPEFTIMQYAGIIMFLGVLMPKHYTESIKKEYKDSEWAFLNPVLAPWLTLFIGYLVHLFY